LSEKCYSVESGPPQPFKKGLAYEHPENLASRLPPSHILELPNVYQLDCPLSSASRTNEASKGFEEPGEHCIATYSKSNTHIGEANYKRIDLLGFPLRVYPIFI
jgi:hypothetical protein